MIQGKEADRLRQSYSDDSSDWLFWGPYLSERQWGTVREDYSSGGSAWDYFPHDHARSRAYRWGEDGLAGICDQRQQLCFALAMWNGQDPIIKERLFGLTNGEGNHGEDVKEYYYYLDNTPTHSYMKWLYKYPQKAYPYADLVDENRRRKMVDPHASEYELIDTGVFDDNRYFDVQVEYAKLAANDILIKIRIDNRGLEAAPLVLLPTLWFRNTWSWFNDAPKPSLQGQALSGSIQAIVATPVSNDGNWVPMKLYCYNCDQLLFVENETNSARLWKTQDGPRYPKDGINDHLIDGADSVNPAQRGSKASALYRLTIGAGDSQEIHLRLSSDLNLDNPFGPDYEATFQTRLAEADEFYNALCPSSLNADQKAIQRQAYAGMLWSKQYYHYIVLDWLKGDPVGPTPPADRLIKRNHSWTHFYADHILTMPDTWEYPWFAAWDLCFQTVVFAPLDVAFAKQQLLILAREFYMSPDGAIPAYEWAFDDVNPPLHAWAALRIFAIEKELYGGNGDSQFLTDIFHYCLLYFTWWTNRKDPDDNNLFEGGFLGLDNISVIDRSHLQELEKQIGRPVELYQSDGTSWMSMFSLNVMEMALILCQQKKQQEYARLASKFFQHFVFVADAINSVDRLSGGDISIWDEQDGFYYDVLRVRNPDQYYSIQLRSLVGIITLFPVAMLDFEQIESAASGELKQRIDWFEARHPELLDQTLTIHSSNEHRHLLTLVKPERLRRILSRVFDEEEFLSPHGIRGISRVYLDQPFTMRVENATLSEQYEPAESSTGLFGGNSNWRGPVWFPINYLFIDALRRYHAFFGDAFTVEYPTRSGRMRNLNDIADDLSQRLIGIFERSADGTRPVFGGATTFQQDPHWRDMLLFYEYFHGDNAAGIGASHQTGWTGLVSELLRRQNGASAAAP